ncbi:hypothetical protein SAMN05660199_02643 [Klenkia soli]|uniref:Uncharacterized protein n=1 Tax=Klenkia soli TaxID=1052260 RepID=A0A1H0MUN2_9ACTN|nr:hypothetical protein [Klenkia soli]SDO84178.1 hypothetical protein SAMN05660199_02643 [Klenkia soli]
MLTAPPTPTRVRDDTWLWALAGLALGLFGLGFLVRWRCTVGPCSLGGAEWIFDLDAVGGLPRLYTTSLFVAATVCAVRAVARSRGRHALWWLAVALIGVGLVFAKLVSAHSVLEGWDGAGYTLAVGSLASAVGLPVLGVLGRVWRVPGARAVVLALAVYALAALGLDVLTGSVVLADPRPLPVAAATFVEELGEALTALTLLAVLVRRIPPPRNRGLRERVAHDTSPRTAVPGSGVQRVQ